VNQFIVAEITKNWQGEWSGPSPRPEQLLCGKFELAIEVNRQRGYRLHSFQLHRLMTGPDMLNETIIAVFERVSAEGRGRP
jgi:hypothetical protein